MICFSKCLKLGLSCLLFSIFFCSAFSQTNNQETQINYIYMGSTAYQARSNYHACRIKYTHPDKYETETNRYIIYTGNEQEEQVDITTKTIILKSTRVEWVEKWNSDKEELFYCYEKIPEITEELKLLLDTTQSINYVIMDIDEEILAEKGGYIEWIEVVCSPAIDDNFIEIMQNALGLRKFYFGEVSGEFNTETRNSLRDFQRANNYPIGYFDLESLTELGVIH